MVICNTDNEEIKKLAHKTIEVPHQVDCLQGILTIIPIQLLSMHIAELRNCDVSTHIPFCVLVTFLLSRSASGDRKKYCEWSSF